MPGEGAGLSPVVAARRAGALLHPTSLPGPGRWGTVGVEARRFLDWLAACGLSWWQMLPVTVVGAGGSPYAGWSAFAGDVRLVDRAVLEYVGLLERRGRTGPLRRPNLDEVAGRIEREREWAERFGAFVEAQRAWLPDAALFAALARAQRTRAWLRWPPGLRDRRPDALREARRRFARDLRRFEVGQFAFEVAWTELRRVAGQYGVGLLGDLPFFVEHASADVWAHRALFALHPDGRPAAISGVPPDAFSAKGQRWGHPQYAWDAHRAEDFAWWRQRLTRQLRLFDAVRLDHFRGFVATWSIDPRRRDARRGAWVPAPAEALLRALSAATGGGPLPLVAEDLGVITREVEALRDAFGLPGMRVLQFAFDGDPDNPHIPFRHTRRCVVYTGTHDNDTTAGWYRSLPRDVRGRVLRYVGRRRLDGAAAAAALVRIAWQSVANLAVAPVQDFLGLGSEARMNRPGTPARTNWCWRLDSLHPLWRAADFVATLTGETARIR